MTLIASIGIQYVASRVRGNLAFAAALIALLAVNFQAWQLQQLLPPIV